MEEIKKLKRKFINKRINAKKENIPFELTFNDFIKLSIKANITSNDMNIKGYHLSRYNDIGPYSIINCRFLYYRENYKERKSSVKVKESSKINILKATKILNGENKSFYQNKARKNWSKWWESLSDKEKKLHTRSLSDEEIKKRHTVIISLPNGPKKLTEASKILKVTPQYLGRFLKKYPIIYINSSVV